MLGRSIAVAAVGLLLPIANAYAASEVIYTTTGNGTDMATIDSSTGTSTILGPTGYTNVFAAALDTDDTLWTIVNGFTTAQIATVDKTTGQATVAPSPIGTPMIALEIGSDGTLYGIGYNDQRLYTIDKATGVGTPIGPATGIITPMDLAFDCDGELWATANGSLWTLDTTTGLATAQSSITGIAGGAAMVMGLMFDSSCQMLATTYVNPGDLYSISALGVASLIGSTGLNMPHGGSITVFVPDSQAPTTTDDVPGAFRNAPVRVTLDASDGDGSGVTQTYYTVGANPAEPDTSSSVYDPANKPVLGNGERIRYFSVDAQGNAETAHSSAAAKVDMQAPATTDNVPASAQRRPVTVTLTATDNPTTPGSFAGVAKVNGRDAIYYETGVTPAAPTTASRQYDPASKPVLNTGETIRYIAVDQVGNVATPQTSRAAVVLVSRRDVTIHLRKRFRGHAVRSIKATIDGREAKVRRTRRRYVLRVDMRGFPCGTVKVRIRVVLVEARAMTLRREFRTCAP